MTLRKRYDGYMGRFCLVLESGFVKCDFLGYRSARWFIIGLPHFHMISDIVPDLRYGYTKPP